MGSQSGLSGGTSREQLKCTLSRKLWEKHGSEYGDTAMKVIETVVSDFVDKEHNIDQAKIQRLENTVKRVFKESLKYNSKMRRHLKASGALEQQKKKAISTVDSIKARTSNTDEWILLNHYSTLEHEKSEREKNVKRHSEKLAQRRALDQQVHEKHDRKIQQKKEEMEYFKYTMEEVKRLEELEQQKQHAEIAKMKKMKEIRDKQIRELQAQRDQMKISKIQYEKQLLKLCEEFVEKEKKQQEERREEEQARMKTVFRENQLLQRKREEQKLEEAQKEIERMRIHAEQLDKEERDRHHNFSTVIANQIKFEADTEKMLRKDKEKEREYERKLLEYVEKKEEADARREKERILRIREESRKCFSDLEQQRKEKELLRRKQELEDQAFSTHYREQGEEAQKQDLENRKKQREKARKHQLLLKKQVEENQKASEFSMDEKERLLNLRALEKLGAPDTLNELNGKMQAPNKRRVPSSPRVIC